MSNDAPRHTAEPPKVCKTRYTGEPEETIHAEHDPHLAPAAPAAEATDPPSGTAKRTKKPHEQKE